MILFLFECILFFYILLRIQIDRKQDDLDKKIEILEKVRLGSIKKEKQFAEILHKKMNYSMSKQFVFLN